MKHKLAEEFNAPINGIGSKYIVNNLNKHQKGLVRALSSPQLPTERKESILAELRQLLALSNNQEITEEMIRGIESLDPKSENPGLEYFQN